MSGFLNGMLYEQANEDRRRLGCLVMSDRRVNQFNRTKLASLRLSNLKCNQAALIARFVYCVPLIAMRYSEMGLGELTKR